MRRVIHTDRLRKPAQMVYDDPGGKPGKHALKLDDLITRRIDLYMPAKFADPLGHGLEPPTVVTPHDWGETKLMWMPTAP